jgi:hypothetical protein
MSLPYFKQFGWEPVVVCVDDKYVEGFKDILLNLTVPADIIVHKVKALPAALTRKIGLGSLSLRSFFSFKKKVNQILRTQKVDLIYFSTTAFHVCTLGPYWKRKFNIPFIIDIQDPWRNDFYLTKPRSQRPPKFFLSYNLDKYLEAKTIPKADGIISVSEGYCEMFLNRYRNMRKDQFKVIPFGASYEDFDVMEKYVSRSEHVQLSPATFNVVYVGRGGFDMHYALKIIFSGFKKNLESYPVLFSKIHFYFIGTNYAQGGVKTIMPVASELGISDYVTEIPERVTYFESLFLLKHSDMLVIPGSTDTSYTASKIYPYILASKPLLAVFNKNSNAIPVLQNIGFKNIIGFDNKNDFTAYTDECADNFYDVLSNKGQEIEIDKDRFEPYTAKAKTREQVTFFEDILGLAEKKAIA